MFSTSNRSREIRLLRTHPYQNSYLIPKIHFLESRIAKSAKNYPFLVPNLGNGHLIVDHKNWGSANKSDLSRMHKLEHPIPFVVVGHVGVQSGLNSPLLILSSYSYQIFTVAPCFTIYTCSIKIRSVQDNSIASKNLPEINGNFYVRKYFSEVEMLGGCF